MTKCGLTVGHYAQTQVYAGKSVHLRESCLRENCLRGEVHTVVNAVCLHYERFKADVPCLQLCRKKKKIQLLHCLSSENIYQKGLNNICVNQNCQCAGMIFVRVSAMTCKCWAAALKWGFCAISLWAIKCQLFIPLLLGRRHEQMCGGRWIDSDGRNFSARFIHIMHTGR